MQKHQQFFDKGIDRDTSFTNYSNHNYYDANNLRVISEGGSVIGGMENTLGTAYSFSLNTTASEFDWKSVGQCEVAGYLIIFAHSVSLNLDRIYKVTFSGYIGTVSVKYSGNLGFISSTKLTCIGRNESNVIHKVYWSGESNNMRCANVYEDISTYTANMFDIIPDNIYRKIIFNETIEGGNLKAGAIQYSYQLFNINGQESPFSPPSDFLNITEASGAGESYKIHGSASGTNCNKSISCTINSLSTSFDRVRIVSIFYDNINGIPSINIVGEYQNTGSITFVDTGSNYLGSYTLEEFTFISQIFKCGTLESKNDYLFAGNVEYSEFDVDYDARAYRFVAPYSGYTYSYIYSDSTHRIVLIKNTSNSTKSTVAQVYSSTWITDTSMMSTLETIGDTTTSWIVPDDYNCINYYNDTSKDYTDNINQLLACKFKSNGTTLGAEGVNVSVSFSPFGRNIDSTTGALVHNGNGTYGNNKSKYEYVSFARDETYRFFIVLYDSKGRGSTAKWVADIRMPSVRLDSNSPVTLNGTTVNSNAVRVRFDVANLPSTVSSFQIYRVKRESSDKSIIARGIISKAIIESSGTNGRTAMAGAPTVVGTTKYNNVYSYSPLLYNFISPDILFNKTVSYEPDYIEYQGEYTTKSNTYSTEGTRFKYFTKYSALSSFNQTGYTVKSSITSCKILGESKERERFYFPGETSAYTNRSESVITSSSLAHGYACTNMIMKLSSQLSSPTASASNKVMYGILRRNVFGAQYGGNTYKARLQNQSIPCSQIITVNNNAGIAYGYGDTYIGYFSILHTYMDRYRADGETESTIKAEHKIMLPIESDFNPYMRLDRLDEWYSIMSRDYALTENTTLGVNMWTGTNGKNGVVFYPDDVTDLYQYNNVYSKVNDTVTAYPKQEDISTTVKFPNRIIYSDKKTNGELSDSWTKFRVANMKDVDSAFGDINKLFLFKNQMFFFQDRAYGSLSIERQSTINDNNAITTVLGTGGILDRYDYFSTQSGTTMPDSVCVTNDTFYWYDNYTKSINLFSEDNKPLSKIKGLYSTFNNASITNVASVFDKKNNEVLFTTISDPGYTIDTLSATITGNAYGSLTGVFLYDMSKYDLRVGQVITRYNAGSYRISYIVKNSENNYTITTNVLSLGSGTLPNIGNVVDFQFINDSYIDTRTTYVYNDLTKTFSNRIDIPASFYISFNGLTLSSSNMMKFHAHNYGSRGLYYSRSTYADSTISLIINPNNQFINRFDVIEWLTDVLNNNTALSNTISSIRISNSYQDTGVITLTPQLNIKQRFRLIRFNTIRNSSDSNRMKDSYIKIDLTFTNSNNYKFVLRELFAYYVPIMKL